MSIRKEATGQVLPDEVPEATIAPAAGSSIFVEGSAVPAWGLNDEVELADESSRD